MAEFATKTLPESQLWLKFSLKKKFGFILAAEKTQTLDSMALMRFSSGNVSFSQPLPVLSHLLLYMAFIFQNNDESKILVHFYDSKLWPTKILDIQKIFWN